MNGKGVQACEVIKESGREGCETVFTQIEKVMRREELRKREEIETERDNREERPVNKSE